MPEVTTVEVQATVSDEDNFENAAYNSLDEHQSVDTNRPREHEDHINDFQAGSEWYTVLCNRWLSLFGVSRIIMICIQLCVSLFIMVARFYCS